MAPDPNDRHSVSRRDIIIRSAGMMTLFVGVILRGRAASAQDQTRDRDQTRDPTADQDQTQDRDVLRDRDRDYTRDRDMTHDSLGPGFGGPSTPGGGIGGGGRGGR